MNPRVMHYVYRNNRIMLWVVGVLAEARLAITAGPEPSLLQVTIEFLREHDRMRAMALYNGVASVPVASMSVLTAASASSEDEGHAVSLEQP